MFSIRGGRAEALRPGPLLGRWPERTLPETGVLDRVYERIGGVLRGMLPVGPGRYLSVLRRVNAAGEALSGLSDAGLAESVRGVREQLRLRGLDTEPAVRAFALVREQAARVLGMRPYDVQVLGGWTLLQGRIAEMQTGEGKTLAATMPAATAALAGIPVHLVTVNDYLAARDAEQMGPLYRALGLTVGTVLEGMSEDERRAAYACDICYCTNKRLVFDYLHDRMIRADFGSVRLRLDGLFAGESVGGRLLLRGLCCAFLDEADSVLVDEARTPLIISRQGQDAGAEDLYRDALALAAALDPRADFSVDPVRREVDLTEAGKARLAERAGELAAVWAGSRRREELVRQALYALELLVRDKHYLVKDGTVQIVDEYTGRTMPDRSWERGLHQLVQAKEGCEISAPTETLARISYQRFFRRYLLLGGMTGTAREVAGELWSVYRLGVVRIPTHRPSRRKMLRGRVFRRSDARWEAVAARVAELNAQGRPVLVGTASVGASERISELLAKAGIAHRVLNARQDADEAETIARAGERGAVTVATNMAGRGTDIALGPGVAELGGLHVIATERHAAGRIDRQLYGRAARQGDPGSSQYLVSLEDELVGAGALRHLAALFPPGPRGTGAPGRALVRLSQLQAEKRHARVRRRLLRLDEQVGRMLAFSGRME